MAMTLRLTEEQDATLTRLAKDQGISKQEAATRAIDEFLERRLHKADVKKAIAEVLKEHGDLLDELSRT
jgi:predicted transcriptional regulator